MFLFCIRFFQSSDPHVYAIGDVCSFPLPYWNRDRVNIQHFQVAQKHGTNILNCLFYRNHLKCWLRSVCFLFRWIGCVFSNEETASRSVGPFLLGHFLLGKRSPIRRYIQNLYNRFINAMFIVCWIVIFRSCRWLRRNLHSGRHWAIQFQEVLFEVGNRYFILLWG